MGAIYWFAADPINEVRLSYWLLLALPWFVAAFMPSKNARVAAGLVIGASWVLATIVLLLAVMAPLGTRTSWTSWLLLGAMAAAFIVGLTAAVRPSEPQSVDLATAAAIMFLAALYEGSVLKASSIFARYEPSVKVNPYQVTFTLESCLLDYKESHGVYPGSIETLFNGSRCVNQAFLRNVDVSYRAKNNPPTGYDLVVERRSLWPWQRYRLITNESGIIQEPHEGNGPLTVNNPGQLIATISQCIQDFRRLRGRFPAVPNDLWQDNSHGCPGMPTPLESNPSNIDGYWIAYDRAPDSSSFVMTARPDHYGVTGIRSYYLDAQGKIHVTMNDRPATPADPLAPECEWRRNVRCQN